MVRMRNKIVARTPSALQNEVLRFFLVSCVLPSLVVVVLDSFYSAHTGDLTQPDTPVSSLLGDHIFSVVFFKQLNEVILESTIRCIDASF